MYVNQADIWLELIILYIELFILMYTNILCNGHHDNIFSLETCALLRFYVSPLIGDELKKVFPLKIWQSVFFIWCIFLINVKIEEME